MQANHHTLWQDEKPRRRMIAVGVAVNGSTFAVMSEEDKDIDALLYRAGFYQVGNGKQLVKDEKQ